MFTPLPPVRRSLKTLDLFTVSCNRSFIRAIALFILLLLVSIDCIRAQETFSSRRITVNEGLPQVLYRVLFRMTMALSGWPHVMGWQDMMAMR
jgi:hypothetical protein